MHVLIGKTLSSAAPIASVVVSPSVIVLAAACRAATTQSITARSTSAVGVPAGAVVTAVAASAPKPVAISTATAVAPAIPVSLPASSCIVIAVSPLVMPGACSVAGPITATRATSGCVSACRCRCASACAVLFLLTAKVVVLVVRATAAVVARPPAAHAILTLQETAAQSSSVAQVRRFFYATFVARVALAPVDVETRGASPVTSHERSSTATAPSSSAAAAISAATTTTAIAATLVGAACWATSGSVVGTRDDTGRWRSRTWGQRPNRRRNPAAASAPRADDALSRFTAFAAFNLAGEVRLPARAVPIVLHPRDATTL